MDWVGHPLFRKFILLLVILTGINMLALDIYFVYELVYNKNSGRSIFVSSPSTPSTPTPASPALPETQSCPFACLNLIETATLSAKPATSSPSTATSQTSKVKDYYIPLGASSFYSVNEWADVPGLEASLDPANFGRITKVVFEASVHVPNGNEDVWVRLYNATDKHPVWFSDLFFPTDTSINFLSSPAITLDSGSKLYKVQMKTQFKMSASLDQSRIHITTE